jgi:hypothetical protein
MRNTDENPAEALFSCEHSTAHATSCRTGVVPVWHQETSLLVCADMCWWSSLCWGFFVCVFVFGRQSSAELLNLTDFPIYTTGLKGAGHDPADLPTCQHPRQWCKTSMTRCLLAVSFQPGRLFDIDFSRMCFLPDPSHPGE